MIVWTLKTCDTCRKALAWLDENAIIYEARDVREDGLDAETIAHVVASVGPERAINRRSTTWRDLPEGAKAEVDTAAAIALIEQHPTLLKRPVFVPQDEDGQVMVGFDAAVRNALR